MQLIASNLFFTFPLDGHIALTPFPVIQHIRFLYFNCNSIYAVLRLYYHLTMQLIASNLFFTFPLDGRIALTPFLDPVKGAESAGCLDV